MIICVIYLLIPVEYMCRVFAIFRTRRIYPKLEVTVLIDLFLFIIVVVSINVLTYIGKHPPDLKSAGIANDIPFFSFKERIIFNTILELRRGVTI